MKQLILIFIFLLSTILSWSQQPIKYINKDSVNAEISVLKENFGKHKKLPLCYENQALIALSYFPELKETPIDFVTKIKLAPLSTNIKFWSIFRKKGKRKFTIAISVQSVHKIQEIIFDSLSYNGQIGVLGHELSHVVDLNSRSFLQLAGISFGFISPHYVDRFEFNTDRICIDHGLGYQLLAWSIDVRTALNIGHWGGTGKVKKSGADRTKRERYMNPNTIQDIISKHPLYNN